MSDSETRTIAEDAWRELLYMAASRWPGDDLSMARPISGVGDYGHRLFLGVRISAAPVKRAALVVHNDLAAWNQWGKWSGIYAHGHSLEEIKAHFDALPVQP